MKAKKFLLAMLPVAAGLLLTACSSDDELTTVQQPEAPATVKTIPFTVTVSGNDGVTRATVDSDLKTLKFQTGDQLYIKGENISGTLDLSEGANTASGTFTGDLEWTGGGTPADDLSLTATLIGVNNKGVKIDAETGDVSIDYGTALLSDVATAVEQYSYLTATSTYSERSFALKQNTAFLNFTVTLDDGWTATQQPAPGYDMAVVLPCAVAGLGSDIRFSRISLATEESKVVAKFVAPVAAGTLGTPTVIVADGAPISFGTGSTLTGKVYNVKKAYTEVPSATAEAVDMGLTVKWANMNVGATSTSDFGQYFYWAGTTGFSNATTGSETTIGANPAILAQDDYEFTYTNAPYHTGNYNTNDSWTKYNDATKEDDVLDESDDAAHVIMGGTWRMPKNSEIQDLIDNTYLAQTYSYRGSGHFGCFFTSKLTGRSIFIPYSGYRSGKYIYFQNHHNYMGTMGGGYNWSSNRFYGYDSSNNLKCTHAANFRCGQDTNIETKENWVAAYLYSKGHELGAPRDRGYTIRAVQP